MPNHNRILITGAPGSGKTTLIKKIAGNIKRPYFGFFTSEIRQHGNRVGFDVESFSGQKGLLANVNINSSYKVSKYGVDIEAFENISVYQMRQALDTDSLLIIDEIGKMELFSEKFKALLREAFMSDIRLIATIMHKPQPFCDGLKKSPGTQLFILGRDNQGEILNSVFQFIEE